MGAWGTSPFDNDDFGDLFHKVSLDLSKHVERILDETKPRPEDNPSRARAGRRKAREATRHALDQHKMWSWCGLVLWAKATGLYIDSSYVDTAIGYAQELIDSPDWVSSWRSPARAKKALKAVLDRLEEIRSDRDPSLMEALSKEFDK